MRLAIGAGAIITFLIVAACADSTRDVPRTAQAGVASGSRLRARVLVADDGARELLGWFDAERNDECAFANAEDDRIRCLPKSMFSVDGWGDDQCSSLVAERFSAILGCPLPREARYARDYTPPPCTGRRVFLATSTFETFPLCRSNGSSCTCFSNTREGTRVGEPIRPADFVESTIAFGGANRVAARMRLTADGSRHWVGWYDSVLGASCTYVRRNATVAACVPKDSSTVRTAAAEGCSGAADPDVSVSFCGGGPERADLATVELLDPMMSGNARSGARLTPYVAGLNACLSSLEPRTRFRDTQLGVDCEMRETVDGSTRCFPVDDSIRDRRFVDAECTAPVVLIPPQGDTAAPRFTSLRYEAPGRDHCLDHRIGYRVVGRAAEGTATFVRDHSDDLRCVPHGATRADDWLLEPMDPSELVMAKIVLE